MTDIVIHMKKVSIIMPCYNAEDVIDESIETLVHQTIGIENIELIFVDDASTDTTLDKLCQWEKRFPESVLVIHCEENGRQGRGRNIGLTYATGEYVGFMDNDDLVREDMYESLYRNAKENCADLVICSSEKCTIEDYGRKDKNVVAGGMAQEVFHEINDVQSRREFLEQDYNVAIWNKLYKREMLVKNKITFLEGMIYDDIYFSGLIKQYAGRVAVIDKVYYYHILRNNNASYGNKDKKLVFGYIEAQLELVEELQMRGKYKKYADFYRDDFLISYIGFIHSYSKQFGYLEISLWNRLREYIFTVIPDILESDIFKKNGKTESTEVILESLLEPVDGKYVLKLVKAMEKKFSAGNH